MMNRIFLIGITFLAPAAPLLFGGLVAPRSLLDLEHQADLIVVGNSTGDIDPEGRVSSFTINVARVIKGDSTLVGSPVTVTWAAVTSATQPGGKTYSASGRGIWFLRKSSNTFELIPVVDGSIAFSLTFYPTSTAALPGAYAYAMAASVMDKIASEVCSAIEAASDVRPFYALQYGLLDQVNSGVVTLHYQRMSTSDAGGKRILGLSGLIRQGSGPGLLAAIESEESFATNQLENGVLIMSIRDYYRPVDAASIAALGKVAAATNRPFGAAFRQAAAHSLAAVHTVDTLPYLAALLDDADATLRMEAIGGIGSFANGLPGQSADLNPTLAHLQLQGDAPYRNDATIANFAMGPHAIQLREGSYLAFWKQWWSSSRASLGF